MFWKALKNLYEDDDSENKPNFIAGKCYKEVHDGFADELCLLNEDGVYHYIDDKEEYGNWIQYFEQVKNND